MFRTLCHAMMMGAAATLMGCSFSTDLSPEAVAPADTERVQLAAYAARTPYPSDMRPSTDLHVGALLSQSGRRIQLENLSDDTLTNVKVWVNGQFVYHLDSLPPHSTRTLYASMFYNRDGMDMITAKAFPQRVELQSGDRLYVVPTAMMAQP